MRHRCVGSQPVCAACRDARFCLRLQVWRHAGRLQGALRRDEGASHTPRSRVFDAQEPENIDNAVACLNHLARGLTRRLPCL